MLRVEDLDTPAVIVFLDRLEANIARVQSLIARQGIGNRPHIKTHKCAPVVRMHLKAGVRKFKCATIAEEIGRAHV